MLEIYHSSPRLISKLTVTLLYLINCLLPPYNLALRRGWHRFPTCGLEILVDMLSYLFAILQFSRHTPYPNLNYSLIRQQMNPINSNMSVFKLPQNLPAVLLCLRLYKNHDLIPSLGKRASKTLQNYPKLPWHINGQPSDPINDPPENFTEIPKHHLHYLE